MKRERSEGLFFLILRKSETHKTKLKLLLLQRFVSSTLSVRECEMYVYVVDSGLDVVASSTLSYFLDGQEEVHDQQRSYLTLCLLKVQSNVRSEL